MVHANTGRKRPDLSKRNEDNAVHGMTKTTEHTIWLKMHSRCYNPKSKDYARYGGRGIKICDRWLKIRGVGFGNFYEDMGARPKGMQIDRIDNNGNYCPENCRWVTPKQNTRNRRSSKMITFGEETKCIAQWADDLGIERKTLEYRLRNMTTEKAFTTPYIKRKAYNYGN